jgi:hypothetical protein
MRALSWNEGEDGDRAGLRIVVIKHMFTPDEISGGTRLECWSRSPSCLTLIKCCVHDR